MQEKQISYNGIGMFFYMDTNKRVPVFTHKSK